MKRKTVCWMTACMVFMCAGLAFAASDGGDMAKWKDFMWRVINFIIFVGILYMAAGKRIGQLLFSRRTNIRQELEDLDHRRIEADQKLRQVEAQIKNLDAERERILADFRSQGEHLKKTIIAQAHQKAEQITTQAQSAAAQEYTMASEKLRGDLSAMIIDAAEQMITSQLSKEGHEKLIQQSITRVVLN